MPFDLSSWITNVATRKRRITARSAGTRKRKTAAGAPSRKPAASDRGASRTLAAKLDRMSEELALLRGQLGDCRRELMEAREQNACLFNETKEALEQQTATAEILRVISSSPTDLQPVFDAILEGAARLCYSHLGTIGTYDGEKYQFVAVRAGNADVEKWVLDRGPFRPHPGGFLSKVLENGEPFQTADLKESTGYRSRRPLQTLLVEQAGVRTHLTVPMLKEGRAIGTISMFRTEVRPFTQRQIDLVSTFANQAVIAIENVRLFKELQARNAEVTEALEQQTATAEILRVISSTPTDVMPVLEAVTHRAAQLCDAPDARLFLVEGDETADASVRRFGG